MKKTYHVLSVLMLMLFSLSTYAQTSTVSGTVIAEDGLPLPGATILLKGTTTGASTDFDGNFSIQLSNSNSKTLVISYIGYKTEEIALTGMNQTINVTLMEDSNALDEVVLVGSSVTQSRKKLGNAITTVKSVELVKASPANITTSLQGKVPGAQITQNSGDPAGGFSIRLRGPSTIKGSSEPLYVVDGVITSNLTTNVTNLNVDAGDAAPGQNRMVDINPNDIENVNILNGAAAAAIYGSRASNGVVVITTKKGGNYEDGPEFYFKSTFSVNTIRKKLDLNLIGEEFETVPNSDLSGRLWPIFGFDPNDGNALTTYRNLSTDKFETTRYDYQDEIFQTGFGSDNYFSTKGGNEKMGYMASIGYLTNEGIIKNTKFDRFSARVNFNHKVTDWMSYDLGLYYANSKSDEKPDGNVFWSPINSINITNNTFDITQRDANGNLMAVENTRVNPLTIIETFDITQDVNHFIPNLHLKIKPTEKLSIDQIIGVDTYNQKGNIYIPVYPYENVNPAYYDDGYIGSAEAKVFNWNYDINMAYNTNITDKLNSVTTAGYSFQSSELSFEGTQGRGLDSNNEPTIPLQTQPIDTNLDIYGFFLQETLSWDNKLFLTLAGRIDGATNFDVDERSNFYPKVSGSYVLSNEPFWNTESFLNSARLRASYGEAGNLTAISPYERYGSYTSNDFLGSSTLQQNTRLGNEGLKPERTKEFEIGTDLSFFNNRASLLFTYYRQNIEDLIVSRVLAPSLGGSTRTENVGTMRNNGIELYAKITPIKTDDLTWDLNFNYSSNRNKVLSTVGGDITIESVTGAPPIVREGESLGVFYGTYYATDDNGELILTGESTDGSPVGVPQQERGDLTTNTPQRDADGQPTGDVLRKVIGDPNPDYILGIGTDLTYKNFNFSMLWEAVQGFDVFDADKRTRQGVGVGQLAAQELTGELPRGYIAGIYPIEEFRIEDGSFVKLREVSLGYEFPSLFNSSLENVRLSLIGRNLVSFDKFFSYDPETNAGGQSNLLRSVNFGNVPIPMTISLSLSANF
ncbi:TonB-linked outer membrane protein, SusC/RagA family [Maribacter dokdonensis]|uniref:TonB-linked outer membrane protein, SusC/RagA family n=1 Tax=Maribacter dokdonensis TaxID=320912 RepID=A0ABY0UI57_9FLAO|nr:SusC/RagA family TonB-linked outer membrane protein [Maribacter dokdonensis]SDS72136.1 TonB-linked outer membrane protein, SusC/RagA family [Maribacter dokdonensis]